MSGKVDKKISESDKHQGDTTALVYNNGILYSGGADGKIKVRFKKKFKRLCNW